MTEKAPKKTKKATLKLHKDFAKLRGEIAKYSEILQTQTWVAIDPSCVSASSEPGFAIFEGLKFQAQGTFGIKYKYNMSLALRLQLIREVVQKELAPHVSLCVIEQTPDVPLFSKKGAESKGKVYMNPQAIASLKQACGAIKGGFDPGTPVIDITPACWHLICRKHEVFTDKDDSTDARCIGSAIVFTLQGHENDD